MAYRLNPILDSSLGVKVFHLKKSYQFYLMSFEQYSWGCGYESVLQTSAIRCSTVDYNLDQEIGPRDCYCHLSFWSPFSSLWRPFVAECEDTGKREKNRMKTMVKNNHQTSDANFALQTVLRLPYLWRNAGLATSVDFVVQDDLA